MRPRDPRALAPAVLVAWLAAAPALAEAPPLGPAPAPALGAAPGAAELSAWRRVLDHDPADLAARGVVPWRVLTELEVESVSVAPLRTVFTSRFSAAAEALDGRIVRLAGFFFPMEAAALHERFLLTAWPPTCPYCLPAGPTHMVEVLADEPVRGGDAPLLLEGELELLRDDPSGFHYRLRDARALEPLAP